MLTLWQREEARRSEKESNLSSVYLVDNLDQNVGQACDVFVSTESCLHLSHWHKKGKKQQQQQQQQQKQTR